MKPGGLGACPHSKTTLFHAYPNHNNVCSIMLCPIEGSVNWVGVQLRMFSCLLFSYRVAQFQLVESFTCWIVLLNWPCSIRSWSTDLKGSHLADFRSNLFTSWILLFLCKMADPWRPIDIFPRLFLWSLFIYLPLLFVWFLFTAVEPWVLVANVGPQEFVQTLSYVQSLSYICPAYV